MRGAQLALQREVTRLPDAEITKSLLGKTEAEIRERYGAPVEIAGPRWQYSTANGILLFYAFFENGRVVRVRPEDLRLTEVVPTR
jgi:hypothetical protein